ncbi:Putative aminotransferase class V domain, pyridoxal phosphate-dependent transferase, major [Septoria linicola]|uniref:Aminotransferase class V domain, pyridoxal phosphate-dependent transferase, major n=1 Tax=Septoria linicola TaxID=215465 RepID=A0A9Q9B5G2_9PEZI|nr:Putative aminotransferase class V domain, pyridoxal phosphate-dependent transferase, major [Septoria linicola]
MSQTSDFTALGGTPIERLMAQRDSRSPIEDSMDLLRLLEYPQLMGKTYLDHAGATQPAKSLNTAICEDMTQNLYGNPHSEHGPSVAAGKRVEQTRLKALEFFNADPRDFDLIFTQSTTAAVKLVHDCFRDHAASPEGRNWWYGYHKDSHTSIVGVREGTRTHRCFRNDREVDLWIESRGLGGASPHDVGLFAYPAQSNMTGRRLPMDWPARIRNRVKAQTYTLLDAAAFTSTAQLDLSDAARAPDFVALSFYKIFGAPFLGCLLVKKSAWKVMESRKYFGGGTVEMVIAVNDSWVEHKGDMRLHERLEDGTLPLRQIFELDHAIDVHRKLYGQVPMKYISMHTTRLIKKLHDDLAALRHSNGMPVVKIYKDRGSVFGEAHLQGATIAFNIQKDRGGLVKYFDFEKEADAQGIFVRSGSLCNPGGTATYLNWTPAELKEAFAYGHKCSNPQAEYQGKPLGVIRASLGAMSTEADIEQLVEFIKEKYIDRVFSTGGPISMPQEVLMDAPKNASATVLHVSD